MCSATFNPKPTYKDQPCSRSISSAANGLRVNQFAYFSQLTSPTSSASPTSLGIARESVDKPLLTRSLAGAKDVHESHPIRHRRRRSQARLRYSRTAATPSETNNEEESVREAGRRIQPRAITPPSKAFKYAPAGSESVVENVKTAMAAAQSAYNNVASINKQIYDSVEKTVEQNVNTVKSAASKTTKAKKATKR